MSELDANLRISNEAATALVSESAVDLFEDAPSGYLLTLPDGTIIKVNRTLLSWTGYQAEQLVGTRFQDLLNAGSRIFYETHYAPLLRMQGSVREIALDLKRPADEPLAILANSTIKVDDAGKAVLIRTSIFEATHRRQYERELVAAKDRSERSEARARALAQTLQESLMPPSPPKIPGVDVGTAFRPAGNGDEVGGDFYDFFETASGDWSVVIGDVAGKGAAAAAITAHARYTIRAAAITSPEPAGVMSLLNEALLLGPSERTCTAIYGRLARTGDGITFNFSSAGHPLPLHITASGGVSQTGNDGMLLGAFDEFKIRESQVRLSPGDSLVMFTDGVTEARGDQSFFGDVRVQTFLAENSGLGAEELATAMAKEVLDFQNGFSRDDVAIVVLRCAPGQD